MKEKMREFKSKLVKLFQKEREKEALTLNRKVFDKLYQPSTISSFSESLKCKLLPSSNLESASTDQFKSPTSPDFHTSSENRAFFTPTCNDQHQQPDSKKYTMAQLCLLIDDEIADIQNKSSQDIPSPQRFLSNSSLATVTQIQSVKFDNNKFNSNKWGSLYNINQYPSDSKQWSFCERRAATTDAKQPKLIKVIKSKTQY
ncbi:hypothetical protein KGF57_002034 [Candida theae]|uniref:Uncharacterized protein n=1 Tax=Candida theae TaxID=1198502 RepID=A0AAD5BFT5_9ASCO|nr:uncharacterized protein KGF57_002034 [Candida theae]KAI5959697.1 hypothetical protein KGF57_002034 [Candida theae]